MVVSGGLLALLLLPANLDAVVQVVKDNTTTISLPPKIEYSLLATPEEVVVLRAVRKVKR